MLEQMRRYAKLKKMPQLITMHSNREFSDETPAFTDPDPVTTSRALTDAVSSGLEYAKGVAPAGPIKEWIEKAISKLSPADGSRGLDFYALQDDINDFLPFEVDFNLQDGVDFFEDITGLDLDGDGTGARSLNEQGFVRSQVLKGLGVIQKMAPSGPVKDFVTKVMTKIDGTSTGATDSFDRGLDSVETLLGIDLNGDGTVGAALLTQDVSEGASAPAQVKSRSIDFSGAGAKTGAGTGATKVIEIKKFDDHPVGLLLRDTENGTAIKRVTETGMAAKVRGLAEGQLIVAVNGTDVTQMSKMETRLEMAQTKVGECVKLGLRDKPSGRSCRAMLVRIKRAKGKTMGIKLEQTDDGIQIATVLDSGLAKENGALLPGMIIVGINGQDVRGVNKEGGVDEVLDIIQKAQKEVAFRVIPVGGVEEERERVKKALGVASQVAAPVNKGAANGPGHSSTAQAKLMLDYEKVAKNREQFGEAFKRDIAQTLSVSLDDVLIINILPGSVVIDFEVAGVQDVASKLRTTGFAPKTIQQKFNDGVPVEAIVKAPTTSTTPSKSVETVPVKASAPASASVPGGDALVGKDAAEAIRPDFAGGLAAEHGSADDQPKELELNRMFVKVWTCNVGHDLMARYYATVDRMFSFLIIALNGVTGSMMFATTSRSSPPDTVFRIFCGILGLASAVLSALRIALRFEALRERHRTAAARYTKMWILANDYHGLLGIPYKRNASLASLPSEDGGDGEDMKSLPWKEWCRRLSDVTEQSPPIPTGVYDSVKLYRHCTFLFIATGGCIGFPSRQLWSWRRYGATQKVEMLARDRGGVVPSEIEPVGATGSCRDLCCYCFDRFCCCAAPTAIASDVLGDMQSIRAGDLNA